MRSIWWKLARRMVRPSSCCTASRNSGSGGRELIGPLAAAGFRVIAPDQRGYNLSGKPRGVDAYRLDTLAADVTALADACSLGRFSLVGHDWGASVAWWTATKHPERLERLVILNAPHPGDGPVHPLALSAEE